MLFVSGKHRFFLAPLIHNEPVRYAIEATGLASLEQRLCPPYFENLDKWHLAVFCTSSMALSEITSLLNLKSFLE